MENLVNIQNELKVPKGNFNSFGKYKYRSAEDILEAVKPLLLKYNCTLTLTDSLVLLGTKVYLQSTAQIFDGKTINSSNGHAETSEHKGMSAEQTTGTASSYARKYALNGLFLIDETQQDADNETVKPKDNSIENKVVAAKLSIDKATDNTTLNAIWNTFSAKIKADTEIIEYIKTIRQNKGI
jgi:hypothetical protein